MAYVGSDKLHINLALIHIHMLSNLDQPWCAAGNSEDRRYTVLAFNACRCSSS